MLPGATDLRISLVELLSHMCPVATLTLVPLLEIFLQPGRLALSGMEKNLLGIFASYWGRPERSPH